MGPRFTTVFVALFLGAVVGASSLCLAQDQPENKRKLVSQVTPVYPELANRLKITGTVKVEATVAPNGKVLSTQVVGGSPVLVTAAVNAIEKWRWAAGPQETKELIELHFHP